VTIKILGSPYEQPDYYVGFNLAEGINADTKGVPNRVTLYSKWGRSSPLSLVGSLLAGQTFRVPSFDYDGNDLIIFARSIRIDGETMPSFADVDIYLSNCPPNQCGQECHTCCDISDCPVASEINVRCQPHVNNIQGLVYMTDPVARAISL
jgi:hypothetical protein